MLLFLCLSRPTETIIVNCLDTFRSQGLTPVSHTHIRGQRKTLHTSCVTCCLLMVATLRYCTELGWLMRPERTLCLPPATNGGPIENCTLIVWVQTRNPPVRRQAHKREEVGTSNPVPTKLSGIMHPGSHQRMDT